MASLSKHPSDASEGTPDLEYLYASNTNVSNFVSDKLSGKSDYERWKAQMYCLMDVHDMRGLVGESGYDRPRASSVKILNQYESLLKGWIFGSVDEAVLSTISDLKTVKDIWNKLKDLYDHPTSSTQQDDQPTVSIITVTDDQELIKYESIEIDDEKRRERKGNDIITKYRELREELDLWPRLLVSKKRIKRLVKEKTEIGGNTMLHVAVGVWHNYTLKILLQVLEDGDEDLTEIRNSDGSTALHMAAIVDNTPAAKLLLEQEGKLWECKDLKGRTPLDRAAEYMNLRTITYLLKKSSQLNNLKDPSTIKMGVNLLVSAISAKETDLAWKVVERNPEFVLANDKVLMCLARTFPSGLDNAEKLIYPMSPDNWEKRIKIAKTPIKTLTDGYRNVEEEIVEAIGCQNKMCVNIIKIGLAVIVAPPLMLFWIFNYLTGILISFIYSRLFKVAALIVPPIKHIEKKKRECEKAKEVLALVCKTIEESERSPKLYYLRPILEAARQNSYEVVEEILSRWPNAIDCKDETGHDIIQLAVIHRSEKVYNLIYMMAERTHRYRTLKDPFKNNMLHLAGRLAPSHKLRQTTGAALQLQRELQWRQEVKELVFPSCITKKNILKETPDMVFTKEHKNLMKEGEEWMKKVAESCSITATLISTIVFAAAITVPGGSNQNTGIPLFRKEIAFTVFALSDAISLFSSTTALLLFLSILTARFAEEDFLHSLPRRLIIGLCALMLSTIAMMIAFGATLFLVFCNHKQWMLAPIAALACIPITSFVRLQFPLIIDLIRSTCIPKFGFRSIEKSKHFDPNEIRFMFG